MRRCSYWCYNQSALSGNLALDFALEFNDRTTGLLTGYENASEAIGAYRNSFRGKLRVGAVPEQQARDKEKTPCSCCPNARTPPLHPSQLPSTVQHGAKSHQQLRHASFPAHSTAAAETNPQLAAFADLLYQDSVETLFAYAAFDAVRTFFETRLDAAVRLAIYLNPVVGLQGSFP